MRLLLCAVGDAAAIFVKAHILPAGLTPIARVISGQSDKVFERTYLTLPDNKQQVSELYIHKDIAVCLHIKTLKQQFAMSWAKTVSNFGVIYCQCIFVVSIINEIPYRIKMPNDP